MSPLSATRRLGAFPLTSLLALAFAFALPAGAQSSSDIVLKVSSPGGPPTDVQKKYTASLFTLRTGIRIQFVHRAAAARQDLSAPFTSFIREHPTP